MFAVFPPPSSHNLSTIATSCPAATHWSTICDPINPAPPVTSILIRSHTSLFPLELLRQNVQLHLAKGIIAIVRCSYKFVTDQPTVVFIFFPEMIEATGEVRHRYRNFARQNFCIYV